MIYDCVIVGGGVIGLSIAYELSRHGYAIALIEKNRIGREASWAGAGILPAANFDCKLDPIDQLRGLSQPLHQDWANSLQELTGIDNGFWNCGAVYLGRTPGETSAIAGIKVQWQEEEIPFENLNQQELVERLPAIQPQLDEVKTAVWLPGEAQLCNPDHLRALTNACRELGVDLFEETDVLDFGIRGNRLDSVTTTSGPFQGKFFCAASGTWTHLLMKRIDINLSMLPVRGQMLAFKLDEPKINTIVNDGSHYLVPRRNGWVLAGSTMEHAGFDKSMTAEGQRSLFHFANGLFDELNPQTLRKRWAGLRPATYDGFPYIGRCPTLPNVIVATGHFRFGLQTSTGTAQLVKELVEGAKPAIDLEPFRISRG